MARRHLFFSLFVIVLIFASAGIPVESRGSAALQDQGQEKKLTAGRNVNMVSGITLPNGDPYLQRQNEPSITVSTRNTLHLLAGSNDYRTVDMPLENEQLPGREGPLAAAPDAWLGLYKSVDGGQSWASTLLPGFPQDTSAAGMASPLKFNPAKKKGFTAAADPVVRSGPSGMFYYSGIAFNRTQIPGWVNGALFISRFIDKNNTEAGDAIQYIDTQVIATNNKVSSVFIDKPWIAVDAPQAGAKLITISGQNIPRHNVYIAYSIFVEEAQTQTSSINFRQSTDCGKSWGAPLVLNQGGGLHQGATIAIDPRDNGNVYVAWRRFDAKKYTSSIMVARSRTKGATFESSKLVAEFTSLQGPFDQPSTITTEFPYGTSFRTNSYPTMTVDDKGIVYLSWAQRGYGPTGESRIVLATSTDGRTWTTRAPIDSQPSVEGHQFMPSLAFAAGKLTLAWYDQRTDYCGSEFGFDNWISDSLPFRHTIDVRAAQADTVDFPNLQWKTTQISRYNFTLEEDRDNRGKYKAFQSQWNPPNYPLFSTGTLPFHGDYLDLAPSPMFVRSEDGRWRFNTAASDNALFHVAWTDNRDVRPPFDGLWANYAPPTSTQLTQYITPGRPVCTGGQQPGMRNQNVYTAQLISGIEAGSPTNAKALDLDVPRAFAVFVKNNTWDMRSFRLTIAAQPPNGQASFLQFDPLEYLDVTIAPYSTISRQVFINSTNPKASVLVRIEEIYSPDGLIIPDGMTGSVLLNGDPTSSGVVGGEETHQPQIENPHIRNWSVNAIAVNPEIDNEDIVNTDIVNPNIVNLDEVNPALVNPNVVDPSLFNPHIRNTNYLNPNYVNPHIRNPHIRNESPSDLSVTDVEWPVKNTGNTASSFSFTLIAKEALPEGLYAQLIVYKVHYTPAVAGGALQSEMNINGCELKQEPHHEILLNVVNPDFVNPHIRNPNLLNPHIRNAAIENATFALGPGEEAVVNLRIIKSHEKTGMMKAMTTLQGFELPVDIGSFIESVGAAVTAQSVDSVDAAKGIKEPKTDATLLVITTSSLPPGLLTMSYPSSPNPPEAAQLQAAGGTGSYSWWVNPDELPPGLSLNAASGQISGVPLRVTGTYPRVYSFTVQVTDSGSPQQSANQSFSIAIEDPVGPPPPLAIITPSPLPVGTKGKPYGTALSAAGGVWPYTWTRVSGSLPPGLNMDDLGTIGGTPSLAGTFTFSVRVRDSATPAQTQEKGYSLTIREADAATFTISGVITLGVGGPRLANVLMRGLPSAPSTDASGSYSDPVPAGWSGTVVPFKAGYSFVPAERVYSNVLSHFLSQNYVAYPVILDHFDISAVGNATAGVPFAITITAKDADGKTVTTYTDANILSDTTGTISPKMTGAFANGVWTGQVAIMKAAQGVTIQTTGGGRTGQSNSFNVLIGAASAIRIEDAPDGTGTEVVTKTLGPGHMLTVYAISRDLGNNFIGNVAVGWSLINKTGGVVDSDLAPAADTKSAVFTAHAAGTARIYAQHAPLGADTTGTIRVMEAQVDDSYEDNDYFNNAAPLSLDTHTDLVLKDPDWFKITVSPADAGKDLMIHLKGVSYPDPDIRRDLDMIVLGSDRMWGYNISGSDDEYAFIAGVAAGDYYIGQTYIPAEGIVYSLTAEVGTNFGLGYIEGRLTTSNGYGLANILVELYGEPFNWDISRPMTTTDANGYYRIGYFPGKYTVRFNVYNPDPQQDPLVADSSYLGKTYNSNEVLTLLGGATVPGIDAQLEPGGIIWGRVTDSSGNGLSMARVYIHAGDGTMVTSGYTNVLGNYIADRIPTGNYKVRVRHDANYGSEWYGGSPSLAGGLPVPVMGGQLTSGIDVELGPDMAYLQGRVTDNLGNPISGVLVSAFDEAGINASGANTDAAGNYLIPRLATGEVRIFFNASPAGGNYVSKYFPNEDLLTAAIPVPVKAGETTSGVDAQLSDGGTITGRVTDVQGAGIPGISIRCFDTNSDRYYGTTTDATGNYTLAHIRPDDYKVLFRPETGSLAAEWYNDWSSSSGARVIAVGTGQVVPDINAQLNAAGGTISGTVTNGSPIKNMRVLAYDSSRGTLGAHISSAATDEAGNYRIPRLPGTNYKVYFDADRYFLGYNSEYYAGKSTFGQADVFPVLLGEETANIGAIPLVRTPVDITTTSLPEGRQSTFYSASLEAAGGRPFYFWSIESGILPNGLTLNGKGEIRGNPTAAGTFNFTVRVTDSTRLQWFETQYDTQEFTITIAAYGGTGFVISGKVTAGGSPVAGVVMDGLPGSPATNVLGEYNATVSSGWSGTVTPTLADYAFNPPNRVYTNVTANLQDQDYLASPGYTISGTITLGGAPMPGVLMSGLPGEPRTNTSGIYTAAVPAGWSGAVTPTIPGFSFNPPSREYTNVTTPQAAQDYTATYASGADDRFEDNDSYETAAVITPGTYNDLVGGADEDWFKIYIQASDAGRTMRVHAKGVSYPNPTRRYNLALWIVTESGKLLNKCVSSGDDEYAFIPDLVEGWYYIGLPRLSSMYRGIVYSLSIDIGTDFGLGFIEGRVMDELGSGIEGIYVELRGDPYDGYVSRPMVTTRADGTYKIGWTPGNYTVYFNAYDWDHGDPWAADMNYIGDAYDPGRSMPLVAGSTVSGIDIRLAAGGIVTGRITDAAGNGLDGIYVGLYDSLPLNEYGIDTDPDGFFSIDRIQTGNYKIFFQPWEPDIPGVWFDDGKSFDEASPVHVQGGQTTPDINARLGLEPGGYIEGTVTDSTGAPLPSASVQANDVAVVPNGFTRIFPITLLSTTTDASGHYRLGPLPGGFIKIMFTPSSLNMVAEHYPDKLMFKDAEPVTVTPGQTTYGIDAQLAEAGTISGRVTDAAGNPLGNINIGAIDTDSDRYYVAMTNATGNYTLSRLSPDDYKVICYPLRGNLAGEWYDDQGAYPQGSVVPVGAGQNVPGIDIRLEDNGAIITGQVTGGGVPLKNIMVIARDIVNGLRYFSYTYTDMAGNYTLRGLPTGQVKLQFVTNWVYGFLPYGMEYYDNEGAYEFADPIATVRGETTSGINVVLDPYPALTISATSLPDGEMAIPYEIHLQASGGKPFHSWSLESGALPNGLTLKGNGIINGVPTATGTFDFTARVIDATLTPQFNSQAFRITIEAYMGLGHLVSGRITAEGPMPLPGVVMVGLPGSPGTNGLGEYVATVSPGWSGTVTPTLAGYAFNPANQTYTNVTANFMNQDFTAYAGSSLYVSTGGVPTGRTGSSYDYTIIAQGGTPPYSWTIASGRLPDGLIIESGGRVRGTPSEGGEYPLTVRVTDSSSPPLFATRSFSLVINPAHQGSWTTTYPLGGQINPMGLVLDPLNSSALYAVVGSRGIYRSTDGGASWTNFTETATAGSGTWFDTKYLNVFLIGNGSQFYMAGNWGLFKSLNQGAYWTRIDAGFSGEIIAMALDPADGNTIYAGTREGKVYKSVNGGSSWTDFSAGLPATEIRFLAVDPADRSKIYAGTGSNGIFRSAGGGAWTSINGVWATGGAGTNLTRVETIVFDPTATANILIAALDSVFGDGIYKTANGGTTWSRVTPQIGIRWQPGYYLAINPADPSVFYAVNGQNIRIYTGGGTGYSDRYVAASGLMCLAVDPITLVLYAGTNSDGVFKSTNGGQTWTAVNNNIRAQSFPNFEAHSLHIDAGNPDIIYAGSINGGYRSVDGGDSWVKMDHPDWQTSAFATHPSRPGTVFSISDRVYKSMASGALESWMDPSNGSFRGFWDKDLVIVPGAPDVLYAGVYGPDTGKEGVYKSTDGGANWAPKNVGLTDTRINVLSIHPSLPNILFAGTRLQDPTQQGFNTRLFRTLDGGETWQQVTCGLPETLGVTQVAFSPSDPNIIYLGAVGYNRGFYKSTDGGSCWVKLNSYNTGAVAVHPTDPNIVYLGTFGSPGFYVSFNGGQSWTQFVGGLYPNPWVDSIALDPRDPFHVFLGTNAGVYEATFGFDLVITTTGLPDAVISQPYSVNLKAIGGTPPYSWSLTSPGSLPAGLSLDPATGVISGQTAAAGQFTLSVKVADANGRSFTKSLTLNVLAMYPLAVNPTPPEGGTVSRIPDKALYTHGAIVEITAVPNPGYAFVGWSGDISGRISPERVVMMESKSIQANFAHTVALPNYFVSSAVFPGSAAAGEMIGGAVIITIGNQGAGSTPPRQVTAGIYLSDDSLVTPDDTLLWKGRVIFAEPPSNETRALSIDPGLQIPTTIAAGIYTIGVIVDDIDAIVELNDGNNSTSRTITISTTGYSHLELLGGWPYGTTVGVDADVSVSRQVALRGHGGLVEIVNISNPSRPAVMSQLNFGPGSINAIKIMGNLAYVAGGTKFFVVDISNLHNPQIMGSCGGLQSNIRDFDIAGNHAYVSDYHYGLRVIDISAPTAPALVGSLPMPDCRTRLIRAFGNTVYVTRHTHVTRPYGVGGLSIVDVSVPAHPVERTFLQNLSVGDLAIDKTGRYLYVYTNTGLKIYDVSNPAAPSEAASYGGTYTAAGIKIIGDRAYLTDGNQNRVFILDITTPASPVEISSFQFQDATSLARPAAAGNLCFVPSWYDSLRIVDFSNLSSPVQVGFLESVGIMYYADVANGQAYVATSRNTSNRLKILNLANPANITQTASLETSYGINDVVASGIHAYLTNNGTGLHAVDVSDPAHPTEVGSTMSAPQAQDIVISGYYAYVADGMNGLKIFDIRTPARPGLLGSCPTPGRAYQLAVSGRYAYLACDTQGLRIIDVSNPQNPREVGSRVFSEAAYNVAVWKNHAYVLNYTGDILWIVDVSNPANPVEIATLDVYYCFGDIGFSGDYMFVPNTFFGLKVVDISSPASPVEVEIERRVGSSCEVIVRENRIYVVDRDAGFYVFEFRTQEGGGEIPPLTITTTFAPDGEMGVVYSTSLQASGGTPPYYWSLKSGALPNGLTLNDNGEIQGTPTAIGTFTFTVRVADSASPPQTYGRAFTIAIGTYKGTDFVISGRVMAAGARPVPGAVMNGLPGNPITNSFGEYIATVAPGWSGTVMPTLQGYAFDPPTRVYSNVSTTLQNQDYAATVGYTISGAITLDGALLPGVLMSGLPGGPRTDSNGFYTASVPSGWSGTVVPTAPGFTFNPPNKTYSSVTSSKTAQDYAATFVGGVEDTYEENDSFETAAVIVPGTYNDLVLADEDWFKVYVPDSDKEKILRVHIKGLSYPDPARAHDLDFCVVSGNRKLLSYSISSNYDEYAYIADLTAGWYYIGQSYVGSVGTVYSLSVDIGTDFGLGLIEGQVTDEEGHGIEGVYVELYDTPFDWNDSRPLITTRADGTYKAYWTPGNFTVRFNLQNWYHRDPFAPDVNYIGQVYNGGQIIPLTAGTTVSGIDARLAQGGTVTGRFTDAEGNGLTSGVAAYGADALSYSAASTNTDGSYILDRLPTGNYKIRFRPGNTSLGTEWYDDAATFEAAVPVPVVTGQTTPNINGLYGPGGYIEGTVTNASPAPIQGVTVTAYDVAGISLVSAATDQNGHYRIPRLPAGPLKVFFSPPVTSQNYVAEYYLDKLLIGDAEPVMVTAGGTTSGIDAQLDTGGMITGRVTDAAGNGLVGIGVHCMDIETDRFYSAATDANGNYTITRVLPDIYKIRFRPGGGNWAVEWFDDRATFTAGDLVSVGAGLQVENINAQINDDGGFITGRVTAAGDVPIEGVRVSARDSIKAAIISQALSDAAGNYTLPRLTTGQARVSFDADSNYLAFITEYYNDRGTLEAGDLVAATRGETTANINAVLAPIPALVITTTTIPNGQQFSPYGVVLQATGGRPFYYWGLTPDSDPLPAGLKLTAKGEIVGTPLATGTYNLIVRVCDSTRPQQSATQAITLTIGQYSGTGYSISGHIALAPPSGQPLAGVVLEGLPGPPATNLQGNYITFVPAGYSGMARPVLAGYGFNPETDGYTDININRPDQDYVAYQLTLAVTTDWLPNGTEGQIYSQILGATGGTTPYTWDLYSGILPDGLTLASNGTLSGTPIKAGTYDFTVRVTDSGAPTKPTQRNYQAYSVTVNPGSLISSTPILVWKLNEGGGTSALDSSGRGLHGLLHNNVTYTNDAAGGWGYAAETAGYGWIEKSWGGDKTFYFANEATIMAYVKIANFSSSRRFVWKLQHDRTDRGFPYCFQAELSIEGSKLVIHSSNGLLKGAYESPSFATEVDLSNNDNGFVLGAYNHLTVTIQGNQYKLFINGAEKTTGTGAPFDAGANFSCFWVMGANWSDYWLGGKLDELTVYNTALAPAQVGARYNEGPLATISGRVTLSGAPLSGVTMNGLPGSPLTNEAGDYTGSVRPGWSGTVTPVRSGYSFEPPSRSYTNVLLPVVGADYTAFVGGSLWVTTGSLPTGAWNSPYDFTLQAANGTLPYSWTIASGRLPAGLTLDTNGRLSGTPTEAGEFPWTVRVTDSRATPLFATRTYNLIINPAHQGYWTSSYPLGGRINPLGLTLDTHVPNTIYAAPQWRGLYKSTSGGVGWTNITDFLSNPGFDRTDIRIFLIGNQSQFYIASHSGVFKSLDQGATWSRIDSQFSGQVTAMALHPTDGNTVHAGTQEGKIYRSENGGLSWSEVSAGLPVTKIRFLAVDPMDPSKVYAGTYSNGIYRNVGGGPWTSINGVWAIDLSSTYFTRVETIAINPADTANIIMAAQDSVLGDGIYKTADGGMTWSSVTTGIGIRWQPGYYIAINPADPGVFYAVNGQNIRIYTGEGAGYNDYYVAAANLTCIAVDPANPLVLYAGTDSEGLFKSINGGQTWTAINNNIRAQNFPHSESHSLYIDASDPDIIYAGSINGGYRSITGGDTWEKINHPSWEIAAFATHPSLPGVVYSIRDRVYKSTDSGASGSWTDPSGGSFGGFGDSDLGIVPTAPNVLYAGVSGSGTGAEGVYISLNGGVTWAPKNAGLTDTVIDTLTMHPSQPDIIFVSTQAEWPPTPGKNTRLFRTLNGGETWEHITCGLPDFLSIDQIAIYPGDPNIMYMVGEVNNGGVYKSTDGGSCWSKILSENASAVAVHPADPDIVYLGTWNTSGFQVSFNGGQTWTRFNGGLPLSPGIESMALDPRNPFHVFIGTTAGVYEATFDFDILIATTSLPNAVIHQPYSANLKAVGGTPPYSWSIGPSGSLPQGITIDAATGVISGQAASAGQFPLNIKVVDDNGQSFTKPLTLNVLAMYPLAATSSPPEGGTVSRTPDEPLYVHGALVEVAAAPNPGYVLIGWSGDSLAITSTVQLLMKEAKSVSANFAATHILPDYTVSSATLPSSASAGETIGGAVSITVGNLGSGAMNPPALSAGIYLSNDALVTPEDILLWKGRILFAGPDSMRTTALPIDPGLQIPTTIAAGTYTIGVLVDDIDAVVERNDGNNASSRTITISSPGYSHLELLGGWPYGSSMGIVTDESRNVAIRGHGGLLEILDISDPAQPTVMSQLNFAPDGVSELDIRGNHVYVAGGTRFRIVDITDLHNPWVIGSCGVQSFVRDIEISGNYAFVSDYHFGLRVVDISNPTAPVAVGFVPFNSRTHLLTAIGNTVYVKRHTHIGTPTGIGGLSVIDATNPAEPVEHKFLSLNVGDLAIDKTGQYLFLGLTNDYLHVYDISTPLEPVEKATYTGIRNPTGLKVVADRLYVVDISQGRLTVLDISNPLNPLALSAYQFPSPIAGGIWRPAVAGNLCLVSSWMDSLRVVDFSNLGSPVEVGSLESVGLSQYADIAVGHAYVGTSRSTSNRLKVLDLANLSNITETASLDTPYGIRDVVISGIHAYLAGGTAGLHAFDISDPAHPEEAGSNMSSLQAQDIVISGNYAYVADGPYGLKIFDIRTPESPWLLGSCPTPAYAYQLAVSGRYAYLACASQGMRIIDIFDPMNPREVGSHVPGGTIYNINVRGNYAFVNDNYDILRIVDVSDPANPVERATVDLYYCYGDIGFSGHYMFIPNTFFGLKVVNISNPASPVEVDIERRLMSACDVIVQENRIYVVNRDAGFYVLELRLR